MKALYALCVAILLSGCAELPPLGNYNGPLPLASASPQQAQAAEQQQAQCLPPGIWVREYEPFSRTTRLVCQNFTGRYGRRYYPYDAPAALEFRIGRGFRFRSCCY